MSKIFISLFPICSYIVCYQSQLQLLKTVPDSYKAICPDCKGTGVCSFCKGHPYAQYISIECRNCIKWNNEYRSKVACPVCKDTRSERVQGCWCTVSWFGLTQPHPGKCGRCHGTGKINDEDVRKKTDSRTNTSKSNGLNQVFPYAGLYIGMKKNAYVQVIQKRFGFPTSYQTGDYNDLTKAAVKDWVSVNRNGDAPKDGSEITYQLYLDILGLDENGDPLPEKENVWNQPKTTNKQKNDSTRTERKPQTTPPESKASTIGDRQDVFYLGVRDGYSEGGYIKTVQRVLHLKETGKLDKPTLDAVKKYITNNKYQQFFTEPFDNDALSVLNDKEKPGITNKLYDSIIRSNDLRILHNRKAKTPEDIID
jgi:hypothetical protein